MTRTHDKNDRECKECMQAFLPADERECKLYHGESPTVWVVRREIEGKTVWARRDIRSIAPVIWTPDFVEGTGFGDFEEATIIAQGHAPAEVLPLTAAMLKEAAEKVKAEDEPEKDGKPDIDIKIEIQNLKIPFPGALMLEMDPTKPKQSVSDLMGLLSAVFGEIEEKPKQPERSRSWAELMTKTGPLTKIILDQMPERFHQWAADRFAVREQIIARMEKMFDEIDELGVMAIHCHDTKLSLALVEARRAVCMALFATPYASPRIDIAALDAKLKAEGVKIKPEPKPEAPAAAPSPLAPGTQAPDERLKRRFRVTYHRPAGHGSVETRHGHVAEGGKGAEARDYGIIQAVDPSDAVQAVIEMTHPYLPVSPDNEPTNADIARKRSEMRGYLKATLEA